MNDAVEAAANSGILFALASGNDASFTSQSPASANHSNIYTVSAIDSSDNLAFWSNYGNPPIDYAAPGVDIESTWLGGTYSTISGTSMAASHVAGLLLTGHGQVDWDGNAGDDFDWHPDPIAFQMPDIFPPV